MPRATSKAKTKETAAPRRADAARNRERILAAAREAFADPAAEVSMAEVSRRAGVGMATLYRNFPGRQELLEALYVDEIDAVCAAAATVEGDTPGARLESWLQAFFDFFSSKRHVGDELLKAPDADRGFFDSNRARVLSAGEPLFDAARAAGEVRDDLTFFQAVEMVRAIAKIEGDRAHLEPILAAALSGLRPT
jgi:AcrR family transcriptional regulator